MKQKKERTHNFKWLLASGGTAVTVFSWELLEEALENVIALGISSFIAILSTFFLIFATQFTKLTFKKLVKFLFPIIKSKIYKEGDDKMKMLKNYWTRVMGNKLTGIFAAVPFAATVFFAFDFPSIWLTVLAVAISFIVAYNIAIFFGGETLAQIQDRLAQATLKKQEYAIVKEAQKRLKQIEKTATQTEAEKLKNDAKEKAKAEKEAKVQEAMAQLQAKAQSNAQGN